MNHRVPCFLVFIALAASSVACGAKCRPGDLGCFLENLVVVESKRDGAQLVLVTVDRDKVLGPSSSSGSGGPIKPECNTTCDGNCVDASSDPQNCGGCGNSCAALGPGSQCVNGACECGPGRGKCNGSCVDTLSDPSHCGGCDSPCGPGASCSGGTCTLSCSAPLTKCAQDGVSQGGYACVDLQTNDGHCGACQSPCPPAYGCSGGTCVCNALICMDSGAPPSQAPPQWINQPPSKMTFPRAFTMRPYKQKCNDPSRCTPAVCFSLCEGEDCEGTLQCTPPEADGELEPTFDVYMGFLAEAEGGDASFTVEATPVSGERCGEFDKDGVDEDAFAEWLESGEAAVGASAQVEAEILQPVDYSGGGSGGSSGAGGGVYCSGQAGFCEACGTVEACCSSSSCYYVTGDGSQWPCNGTDCSGAAQAVVSSCCPTP